MSNLNKHIPKEIIGTKAYNLIELIKNNIDTLPGIVVYESLSSDDKKKLNNLLTSNISYAVRSSMGNEDLSDNSCAGKYVTILDVEKEDIFDTIQKVFESVEANINKAVIVQPMLYSEVSGVIFTADPILNNDDIVIESILGIGENIVSGEFTPDTYKINRNTNEIKEEIIQDKSFSYILTDCPYTGYKILLNTIRSRVVIYNGNSALVSVDVNDKKKKLLTKKQIETIVEISKNIEKIFANPQDIEYGIKDNKLYILQTRDITTLNKSFSISNTKNTFEKIHIDSERQLTGQTASTGTFKGKVKKIDLNAMDLDNINLEKSVVVIKDFSPELIYILDKCGAIVTEYGGILCHGAIISREKAIPCITNIPNVMDTLKDNKDVYVDANKGVIYYDI